MATRSTIALEFADNTIGVVYCHWDGYLSHNGVILQKHYLDPFKVRTLIDHGDISSLGAEIGVKRPFDNPHPFRSIEWQEFNATYENQCLFYSRDRGETEVSAIYYTDFSDYSKNLNREEYNYILRRDGQWYVAEDNGFCSLEQSLMELTD